MGGGGNNLQVMLGNMILLNPSVSGSGLPTLEIVVPNVPLGGSGSGPLTGTGPATDVVVTRIPITPEVVSTLRQLAPMLNGGRITLPTGLGMPTILLPKGLPAEIQGLLATLQNQPAPEVLMGGLQTEAQTSVLTMGSQTVFSPAVANPAAGNHAPASQGTAAQPNVTMPASAIISAGEIVFGAQGLHPQGSPSSASASPTGAALFAGQASRSSSAESTRIPEALRQILTNSGLLPPGIGTDEALPRLQEVLRLWSAGELPAHVAKVVDQVLTSAVLATALAEAAPQPALLRGESSQDAQKGSLGSFGSALFTSGAGRDVHSGPLSRSQIATAILNALTPSVIPPSAQTVPLRASTAVANGEAQPLPSANPAANGKAQGDKGSVLSRSDGRAESIPNRADAVDRSVRDSKIRLTGDEQHERADTAAEQLDTQRAPHDQESHGNSEEADTHAAEALWNQLQSDLRRGGFIAAAGSLRPLEFSEEGREVLGLVAARLPEGWDVIDGLALIDARMGLSPEAGAVNNALYRLASYRKTWKGDKVRAVLEPLHDAFVALELVAEDVIPGTESDISLEDLKGFQTQAAAAQMILDRPRWMARLGDEEDRGEIARVLPDVESLLERVADKLPASHRPAYFKAPEGVALLN